MVEEATFSMSDSEGERRPRLIGARDENEEDSDDDRRGPQPESNAAADGAAADTAAAQVAPEEASKKPASTRRPAFSENDLVKEKGLLQIYKQFPQKCQYKGKGREVSQNSNFPANKLAKQGNSSNSHHPVE